jgi:BirA family biotin operon repressor/biotin-[acetyl-CoA-carboxylase] ligase
MTEIRSSKSSPGRSKGVNHPTAGAHREPRFRIEVFDVLASTNDSILKAGERGEAEGTTHIALTQTRGRGRGDHTWWSPPGAGLWMSTLLCPSREREEWGGISLIAGKAVRDGLLGIGARGIELFWPNDLQVGRKKVGGILGEVRSRGERAWIALGIGVNIAFGEDARKNMPLELVALATSLADHDTLSITEPVALGTHILATFGPLYRRFLEGESVPDIVGKDLAHIGREVEVLAPGPAPRTSWRGTVEGLGRRGELLVRPQGKEARPVALSGGEVIYDPL